MQCTLLFGGIMKNRDFINEIPALLEEGNISKEEAIKVIAEYVMLHPRAYGIPEHADDLRSEMNVRILQNTEALLDRYEKRYCEFSTYLYSFVHYQLLTILKIWKDNTICDRTFFRDFHSELETLLCNYEQDEYEYKILHFTPHSLSQMEKAPYKRKEKNSEKQFETAKRLLQANADLTDYFRSIKSSKEKMLLILALKSSYFIDEEQIKNVSEYCNIPVSKLSNSISDMNDTLNKKTKEIKEMENKRDKEFFLHRKYREEMQDFDDYNINTARAKHVGHLYEYHTTKWKNQNELIKQRKLKNCPSNRSIADVLGICERQVGYYIKNAEKIAAELKGEADKERKCKEEKDGQEKDK